MKVQVHPETGQPCILNENTGELVPLIINAFTKKSKNAFQGGWLAMSQTALESIATNKALKLTDYRVLMLLSAIIDYENFVVLSQVEIAEKLKISKGTLGTSMKKLVDLGILDKGPKWGRNVTYRLSPTVGWKGTARNHIEAIESLGDESTKKAKSQSPHLTVVK